MNLPFPDRFPAHLFGQSIGDKLLAGAWSVEIKLLKIDSDDADEQLSCSYELKGEADGADAPAMLLDLIRALGGKGGVA